MLHRTYIPRPPLSDFVADIWLYEGYSSPHFRERILPSGTIELVINLQEDELRIYDARKEECCKRLSGALVSGAYSGFFVTDTTEEKSIMGVHFKPAGAFPFLGVSPEELANRHVNLKDLWGSAAPELRERLCEAKTPQSRFRLLENALVTHLLRPPEHHPAVSAGMNLFEQTGGRLLVREMSKQLQLSQRRFIQIFAGEVGMTPKLFSRIQRFHRAVNLVRLGEGSLDWAQLASVCGYFDQAHLINDFVGFSGFTPNSYLQHSRLLERNGQHRKRNHIPLPTAE